MRRRSSSRPTTGPRAGIARYLCGTPPVLSLAALECGVDTVLAAEPLGGMAALRAQVAGADATCSPSWSKRAAPATA